MAALACSCFKRVGENIKRCQCGTCMIKHGKDSRGKQRYFCRKCKKTEVGYYTYKAYGSGIDQNIISLTKEGIGILSTARLLAVSPTTLLKRIKEIAAKVERPAISIGKTYEVDEMRTFCLRKSKLVWIVYALERENKKVVSFNVGARTNKTLGVVIKALTLSKAKRIYTDKLINYKSLIDRGIHNFKNRSTNHIERMNLNVRTYLKRLNRRTLAYSKSVAVLSAVLKIYFWG